MRGKVIKTIKYADDHVLIAKVDAEFRNKIRHFVDRRKNYGMEINIEKSKVMRMLHNEEPLEAVIGNQQVESVRHFKYLGTIVINNCSYVKEITRISLTTKALNGKKLLIRRLNIELKKKLYKCMHILIKLFDIL